MRILLGLLALVAVFVAIRFVSDRPRDEAANSVPGTDQAVEMSTDSDADAAPESTPQYRMREDLILDGAADTPVSEIGVTGNSNDGTAGTASASAGDSDVRAGGQPGTASSTTSAVSADTSDEVSSSLEPRPRVSNSGLSTDPSSPEMSVGAAGTIPTSSDIAPEAGAPGISGPSPESSDTGILGLPPEASDPGLPLVAPGANDPQIPGPAPEDSVSSGS